ncbi:DUF499 domain-containing protein [Kitasatospora purpeofusca]|uniref:DUF499 domain-containing protein n=1 Tax=Kitasatospora purpeofusca TaxID=67352 RepID=UPI0035DB61A1
MALSNRERIGRMIELLPEGLLPLVEREMTRRQGEGWFDDAAASPREGGVSTLSKYDPQFLMQVILRNWASYFRHALPPAARNYVGELNDVRNNWAHNTPFNADDTARAMDTAERLLTAVGASKDLVDQVRRSRLEHQRAMIEAETRRAARDIVTTPGVAAEGLKPWREVLVPHADVARGDFNASEFAANLAQVAQGEGAAEYTDPVEFFQRTYLTEGLRDLLSKSLRRITGDHNAPPTVNLQTNFGGGKTHSMLALYHLFSPGLQPQKLPQEVHELVAAHPGGLPSEQVRRVVLVGTAVSPGQPEVKADGTKVNTLWGELAWQLGGRTGYDLVAAADQTGTNPGSALQDLLAAYAPCLILVDEWVAYARQLYDTDNLPAGSFETHFTFAQNLTEAVETVSGAQLVVSIPASDDGKGAGQDTEVGGPAGQFALERLQNIVRRKADPWRPANADESFEIVRRRLFEPQRGEAQVEINKAARVFTKFYANHKADFPSGVDGTDYEKRIKAAYPIHPELFARLYEDWSTLERFQRTRGVLRLMSAVIHALWRDGNQSPMIMPGDIPLSDQHVASELTQYLEDRWKPILDTDVDGIDSTPLEIDKEKSYLGDRMVTRRIARTIFLGSAATLKASTKGLSDPHVRLGMAMPGDTMGNFRTALNTLADRSTYLYSEGNRYRYDTQASVTRIAKDEADRLVERSEDVWAEIVRRLAPTQRRPGDFVGVHIAPQHSSDIPDEPEARLVLLHPQHPHARNKDDSPAMRFAADALSSRGSSQRHCRNMLIFLAPDQKELDSLMEAAREYLGWQKVVNRADELDLTSSQRRQAESRRDQADEKVELRLNLTYQWALVPDQREDPARPAQWETVKVETSRPDIAVRTANRLKREALLWIEQAPALLHQKLTGPLASIWNQDGHISVKQMWDLHTRYSYMNRLRDRSVLERGLEDVLHMIDWEKEGFALATGHDQATGRYSGLVLPGGNAHFGQITDTTLLVRMDLALRQREADSQAAATARQTAENSQTGTEATTGSDQPGSDSEETDQAAESDGNKPSRSSAVPNTRFFARAILTPEQYSKNASKYAIEILPHLDLLGSEVEITIEIHAHRPDGYPDDKVRSLTENASILKLQAEFESD